ncbi:MAG: hypothetical protein QOJ51_5196 [Acidobacteriaceae bacterium]|jgi:hypothetical protein|nr:hypothetical protein [Acidobacteriaceae bacterium]
MLTLVHSGALLAQSGTSCALTGTVSDKTGAGVPNAQMQATDVNTGAIRTARSTAEGRFLFAQMNPGPWRIEVQAEGFASAQSRATAVAVRQTITLNLTLSPAAASQSVEVTARTGLLSLENPNTSTTLEAKTINGLPNPGQDLTYVAQFAQGALMNTGSAICPLAVNLNTFPSGKLKTSYFLEWSFGIERAAWRPRLIARRLCGHPRRT